MNKYRGIFVVLVALCGLVLTGCGSDVEESSAESGTDAEVSNIVNLKPESVKEMGLAFSIAEVKPLVGEMALPAKLIANQDLEAQVGSLVQGRVRKVFVNVGDNVREGQELLHIEGLEVGEIKSNFIKAKAQLEYAEANFKRQKSLFEQNVGSQKAFLETQSEYDKARAEFNAEDKRIHSVGLTDADLMKFVEHGSLERDGHIGGVLPIRAPISGTVVERNVVIGQLMDASTLAFRIINSSTLWAEGQIHEQSLPLLTGKPDVQLSVTSFPGETFKGKVIYISPVVDERTRTITIRASVPNRAGRLKPQMFGELHVPIGGTVTGLLIPTEAVQKDNEATYVFVATSDTTFERRNVELGATFDSESEVRKGIQPGERIVTRGSFQLKSELMKHAFAGDE
ncbi:MAG: efflux RND transporter periplasmic adaptor subunit [Bacteroidota bacterium]|jgi:cobalt-zinc-cadmium efflux system membrane fusion protein